METTPKAFISHASEDKGRFVNAFAKKLREKGVDAWFDKWEIFLGDSLVEKIFEEGIKNADAFIIVLSVNSVDKPWVREELDAGMVKKIEKKTRLIPVIIDRCEIPTTLKHLVWVRIQDLNDYDNEITKIVNTIFGINDKPPLGAFPKHLITSIVDYLPGLTKTDNIVLGSLCRRYLAENNKLLWLEPIYKDLKSIGLSGDEINESIQIFEGRGYLKIEPVVGNNREFSALELYTLPLDAFMRIEIPEYNSMVVRLASTIVNKVVSTNIELYDASGIPQSVVDHILDLFEQKGLIELARTIGATHIVSIFPELKRMLQ